MYILSNTVNASNFVEGVDKAFFLIMGISFVFLIGLNRFFEDDDVVDADQSDTFKKVETVTMMRF